MTAAPAYDVIIIGGGSAGCALAGRLSEDASRRVLLIEHGPDDKGFNAGWLSRMPKGLARLITNPAHVHTYAIDPKSRPDNHGPDLLVRGKLLGGSSSINGMVYHRGQPEDYDGWARLGNPGWGWTEMRPYFCAMENHLDLPATDWRGRGGPLSLTLSAPPKRLAEAIFQAGEAIGLRRNEEPNLIDQRGISHVVANIDADGRRVSAARAFLPPAVRARPNLDIVTDTRADRILFEGKRAVGVSCTRNGASCRYGASREVIISAGALQSPTLLQLSGVGDAGRLSALGINIVHHNPSVGRHMLDHWNSYMGFDLFHEQDSHNREFRGWRLGWNLLRYQLGFRGPLAASTHLLAAFDVAEPGSPRADIGMIMAPFSFGLGNKGQIIPSPRPTMHIYSLGLRPTSEGEVHISSNDPGVPPTIVQNQLATEYDQRLAAAGMRLARRLMTQPALAGLIKGEQEETRAATTDEELIQDCLRYGTFGLHACGTCRMGPDDDPKAVVDSRLRVRGISGLRVVDASVMPVIPAANINGPVMASALRAADLVIEDLR